MSITFRKAELKDITQILDLNNKESLWVGKKTYDFFKRYLELPNFLVALESEVIVGFIMVMSQDSDYDSLNFLWFKQKYPSFLYIDRVVVSANFRRKGIASQFYKQLLSKRNGVPLVCEVSINPENTESIYFHNKMGFIEKGQFSSDGKKICRMYFLK